MDKDKTVREDSVDNQVEGKLKQFKGVAKEVGSNITGDPMDRASGMADRVSGKVQESYGKLQEKVADVKDDLKR